MRTGMTFTDDFYQKPDDLLVRSRNPEARSGSVLLSAPAYRQIPIDEFIGTSDFQKLKDEYLSLVDQFSRFISENSGKLNPPLSRSSIEKATRSLNIFSSNIGDIARDYFSSHKSLIYGQGKEYAHELADLLESDEIPIQRRMNAIVKMSETIALCSGGVMTALQTSVTDLKLRAGGTCAAAQRVKIQIIESLIGQYLKESGQRYHSSFEVHYINAYFNAMAKDFGLPKRNDPFTSTAVMTPDRVRACRKKVNEKLNPRILVSTMADSYLDQVKGVQQVDVSAPIPISEFQDVMARNEAIKLSSLDQEFGVVEMENYLSLSDDHSTMKFAKQSTLIAKEFLHVLKNENIVNYDDAVSLNTQRADGVIKQLGDFFWLEVNGSCEELEAVKLLDLSPREVLQTLKSSNYSKEECCNTIECLTNNILESIGSRDIASVPEAWFADILGIIKSREVSTESARNVLFIASAVGSVSGVEFIIRSGVNVNCFDRHGNTPLMLAVKYRQDGVSNVLLKKGAKTVFSNEDGDTVFSICARHGDDQVLRRLLRMSERIDINREGLINNITVPGWHLRKAAEINQKNGAGNTPMHIAAENGHADYLRLLIWTGGNRECKNQRKLTPLAVAAARGHAGAVQVLLDKGARIEATNAQGATALLLAASGGHTDAVSVLLDEGANIEAADSARGTALMCAATHGHVDTVRALLLHDARVEAVHLGGITALICAAVGGHANVVEVLLGEGRANIEVKDPRGDSVLICAASRGRSGVVRALLAGRANAEVTDRQGATALIRAVANLRVDSAVTLLEGGANIEARDDKGRNALMTAAMLDSSEFVRYLLNKGANPGEVDLLGQNALMLAAAYGQSRSLGVLLERGASIRARDHSGNTALILASAKGHSDATEMLIHSGANIRDVDRAFRDALMVAVDKGHSDVVRTLLDSGPDMTAVDAAGESALMIAAGKGHVDILTMLANQGALVDAVGPNGYTPLMVVAAAGRVDAVRVLIENGADVDAPGWDGVNALMTAAEYGHLDVVRFLIRRHASIDTEDSLGRTAWSYAKNSTAQVLSDNPEFRAQLLTMLTRSERPISEL